MKKLALPLFMMITVTLMATPAIPAGKEKAEGPKQYQECVRKAGDNAEQRNICQEGLQQFEAGQKEQAEATWSQVLGPAKK